MKNILFLENLRSYFLEIENEKLFDIILNCFYIVYFDNWKGIGNCLYLFLCKLNFFLIIFVVWRRMMKDIFIIVFIIYMYVWLFL